MAHLYACLFAGGTVKVGRSSVLEARLKSYQFNGEMVRYVSAECMDDQDVVREAALIERCSTVATRRIRSEWFHGLNFEEVTHWVREFASKHLGSEDHTFGQRLAFIRRARQCTQGRLAAMVSTAAHNVSRQVVGKWEGDLTGPNPAQLARICIGFGISSDDLLGVYRQEPAQSGLVSADPVSTEAVRVVHAANSFPAH